MPTIPNLPAAASVSSADVMAVSQGGVTRWATVQDIGTSLGAGGLGYTPVNKTGDTMTGALSIGVAGTGLAVTNNATVGGTLSITGATILSGPLRGGISTAYSGAQSDSTVWHKLRGGLSGTTSVDSDGMLTPMKSFIVDDRVDTGGVRLHGRQHWHGIGGSTMTGGRVADAVLLTITSSPSVAWGNKDLLTSFHFTQIHANLRGATGGFAQTNGSVFTDNAQTILYPEATFTRRATSGEANISVRSGASAASLFGYSYVFTSDHVVRGTYDDAMLMIGRQDGAQTVRAGLQFGAYDGASALGADSTAINFKRRTLPTNTRQPLLHGMDCREVDGTAGGFPFVAPGFAVDWQGNAYVSSITSAVAPVGKTATLTAVTVVEGGLFFAKPTLALSAPPSGTTATVTVATMGLHSDTARAIQGVVAGGTGYAVGNVLTLAGGTGTAPTITVATVSGGVITSVTMTTQGSLSVIPSNPCSVTGGAGTGATFDLGYAILTTTIVDAGTGYPIAPPPVIIWPSTLTSSGTQGANWETAVLTLTMTAATTRTGAGLLYATGENVGNTGAGPDTLQTYNLPAGQLKNVGDVVEIILGGDLVSSTNAKTVIIKVGSFTAGTITTSTSGVTRWAATVTIVKSGSNTQTVVNLSALSGAAGGNGVLAGPTTQTDTSAITLLVTGTAASAAANDVTCRLMVVRYTPAAA